MKTSLFRYFPFLILGCLAVGSARLQADECNRHCKSAEKKEKTLQGTVTNPSLHFEFIFGSRLHQKDKVARISNVIENHDKTHCLTAEWRRAELLVDQLSPGCCAINTTSSAGRASEDSTAELRYGETLQLKKSAPVFVRNSTSEQSPEDSKRLESKIIFWRGLEKSRVEFEFASFVSGESIVYSARHIGDESPEINVEALRKLVGEEAKALAQFNGEWPKLEKFPAAMKMGLPVRKTKTTEEWPITLAIPLKGRKTAVEPASLEFLGRDGKAFGKGQIMLILPASRNKGGRVP